MARCSGPGGSGDHPDDPIAIVYQGLIHLFYKDGDGRTLLVKYDGKQAWTEPRVFIEQAYPFMPGVTVHAGLLKLAFTRSIANADGRALYQYAYDGNTLSPATVSSNLAATERVGLGVLRWRAVCAVPEGLTRWRCSHAR
ncbi:hypothetical protein NWF32_20495 [Pseudomonas qingdaonensis]|nr:hypothetical protein [Pseudomonas qingdaonensis]